MGYANNLNKFEWENEIPFSEEQVKRTLHAMIGEGINLSGLLSQEKKWDLTCVNAECNDTFGSYSFGQVNSSFSITIKKVGENSSHLHITISERQGAFITGNQAYLQSECNKLIKALTYYLENTNPVKWWYDVWKPESEKKYTQATGKTAKSSVGCNILLIAFIILVVLGVISWVALIFL